ncbi:MAG: polysaccharide deacetylase family protein [Candidatus Omnitrophota bacterium]
MKFNLSSNGPRTSIKQVKAFCHRIILILLILIAITFYAYLYFHYTTPILMYHSFDESKTKNFAAVSKDNFYKQMKFIKEKGYKVIPLNDYCCMLKDENPVPRNLVVITIDDGYKDNLEAIKILKDFNFPATLFVTINRIGKPEFLTDGDIRSILKETRITIGSHTMTHPELWKLSDAQLKNEISDSKYSLERQFKTKVETIAYPGGAYDERTLREIKNANYLCACTTNRGSSKKIDLFSLRRIKATEHDTNFSLWAKLSGFYNVFKKPKKPH